MPLPETDDIEAAVLVLFRSDLRISDNRALAAAAETGKPVVCAFIRDEGKDGIRAEGAARHWWMHHSIEALAAKLEKLGGKLILRRGEPFSVVRDLVQETGADTVLWNRRYDPPSVQSDKALKAALREDGLSVESFDGHLLHEPWQIKTGAGGHYRIYSPFWRALSAEEEPRPPVDAPKAIKAPARQPKSESLADWKLLPTQPDWSTGFGPVWTPGEDGARARLKAFLDEAVNGYVENRDRPDFESTSRLSPHLAMGEITPFQIWEATRYLPKSISAKDVEKFRKEVVWREFSWHLLFHNPKLATDNFNDDFGAFPWRSDAKALRAWQQGQTGYPIVDAGMRQLWQTGWIHNRVRMVCASFLVKHLLIDWRDGEEWFWDTLVDADRGNNPASWQWVAGSGADAAPYFRIFNPIMQGEKFDPDGKYVRAFVPELAKVPDRYLHKPWEAPRDVLAQAGVKLGETYPVPVVDHFEARDRALAAYQDMRGDS